MRARELEPIFIAALLVAAATFVERGYAGGPDGLGRVAPAAVAAPAHAPPPPGGAGGGLRSGAAAAR